MPPAPNNKSATIGRIGFKFILPITDEMQQNRICSRPTENFLKPCCLDSHETRCFFSALAGTNARLRTPILG